LFNDTMSPIYDDEYDIFSPPTIEYKVYCDYDMPLYMIITMIIMNVLLPLLLMKLFMLMWRVMILLCIWIMIRMFHVIAILLSLSMMLLKVFMREGDMISYISKILSLLSFC